MKKVKLLREVLVGPADVVPTPAGTVIELDDGDARHFVETNKIAEYVGEEPAEKAAPEPKNKAARTPRNK